MARTQTALTKRCNRTGHSSDRHLTVFFRAGSESGQYVVTVKLFGGSSEQMFVNVTD